MLGPTFLADLGESRQVWKKNIFEIFYQGSPPCLEVRNFRISEAGILFLQVSSLSRGGIRTKIEKSCWPRFSSFIIFYKCLPSLEVG